MLNLMPYGERIGAPRGVFGSCSSGEQSARSSAPWTKELCVDNASSIFENPEHAYSVVVVDSRGERTERTGLSHVEGMILAEEFQREGKIARVMHMVGSKGYEVDSYPPR
jgi:hypothetical protein